MGREKYPAYLPIVALPVRGRAYVSVLLHRVEHAVMGLSAARSCQGWGIAVNLNVSNFQTKLYEKEKNRVEQEIVPQ